MKEDADSDVDKGKNHDSKSKALMMARVIIAANDKVDTPIPGLLAELAPLKAMKGVKNFKAESKGNGKFEIYLIGSKIDAGEYTIRETTEEENKKINDTRKKHNISKKKNIATFEGEIDGKPLDLVSYSGEDIRPGTVDPVKFDDQILKTQPTKSDKLKSPDALDRRAYDSEAKGLENILRNTTTESTGTIKLISERNLCGSCDDVVKQFRKLRPGIKIEVAYSIPYHNPLF